MISVYRKRHEDLVYFFKMERGLVACTDIDGLMQTLNHMVGHPRCVFINYIWLNQLSNTTNLWWIDANYVVINYMFRRLWPSSG